MLELSAGLNDKYSGTLSLNYNKKKYKLFSSINWYDRKSSGVGSNNRMLFLNGDTNTINSDYDVVFGGRGGKIKLGGDIYFNTSNTLSLSASLGSNVNENNTELTLHDYSNMVKNIYERSLTEQLSSSSNFEFNFNYRLKLKKENHELKANGAFTNNTKEEENKETISTTDELLVALPGNTYIPRTLNNSMSDMYRLKIDYTLPLKKKDFKMEAGIHQWFNMLDKDFRMQTYNHVLGDWNTNSLLSNTTRFDQYNMATYAIFAGKYKGFGFQLGARCEYTDRILKIKSQLTPLHLKRWDIYPTLHLSQALPLNMKLQASYSRRVHRPGAEQLTPDTTFNSQYQLAVGNPNLQPEFTDSYEASLNKPFKGITYISAEFFHRRSNNRIEWISQPVADGVFIETLDNLSKSYNTGLELSSNIEIAKWCSVFPSLTYSYDEYQGVLNRIAISKTTDSYRGRLNVDLKLSANTKVQLGAGYSSPTEWASGRSLGYNYHYASIRQDFFKKFFSINLSSYNFIKPFSYKYINENSSYYEVYTWRGEYPYFTLTLTLTYNFNNYQGPRGEGSDSGAGPGGGGMMPAGGGGF